MLIISKTYQVDRIWSSISIDKYPRHISIDRYPRHIKLIEFGVISLLIDWSFISVDKYSRHISVDNIQDISALIISKTYHC